MPSHSAYCVLRNLFLKRCTRYAVRCTNKAFTLLEVTLTVLLMTIGFIILLEALGIGLFAGGENETELAAINLAQERVETLRDLSYASIANEAKAVVSGYSQFNREVLVTTPQTGLKQVTVSVYWFTKANELNVSLVTYVSNV